MIVKVPSIANNLWFYGNCWCVASFFRCYSHNDLGFYGLIFIFPCLNSNFQGTGLQCSDGLYGGNHNCLLQDTLHLSWSPASVQVSCRTYCVSTWYVLFSACKARLMLVISQLWLVTTSRLAMTALKICVEIRHRGLSLKLRAQKIRN